MLNFLTKAPLTILLAAASLPFASAERRIESKSLNPCLANSSFHATLFNVVFKPSTKKIEFNVTGVSEIAGRVSARFELLVYGFSALKQELNPCDDPTLRDGMCPMNAGKIDISSNLALDDATLRSIPGKAYNEFSVTTTNEHRYRVHNPRPRRQDSHPHQRRRHQPTAGLRGS